MAMDAHALQLHIFAMKFWPIAYGALRCVTIVVAALFAGENHIHFHEITRIYAV